jgi:Holliday junction resolvase
VNSNQKGKRGEREGAKEIARVMGCEARRGQQYKGSKDSPDIVTNINGLHLEAKRTEKLRLYEALKQATEDANGDVPMVIHRQNRKPWVAIVKLTDLPRLYEVLKGMYEADTAHRITPS